MTSPKKEGDGKMMGGSCPQRKANSVRARQGNKKGKIMVTTQNIDT